MNKILLLPIILIFFGCPQKRKDHLVQKFSSKLKITKWSGEGHDLPKLNAFIEFLDNNKGITSVGCNTIGFKYIFNGNNVKVNDFYSTRMYCEDLNKAEQKLIDLLKQVKTYKIDGNQLLLLGDNNIFIECNFIKKQKA